MKKWWLLLIPVILLFLYFAGPAPDTPEYTQKLNAVPTDPVALEKYIDAGEKSHKLKPDNEARIVWNDSSKKTTAFSIVYLHGFSASQFEGLPVHKNIAAKFGSNLYLSRLAEHGIDTAAALQNLTPDKYWESAVNALAIGKRIGDKVILIGTSTGGSNALQLAAQFPDDIYALILLSPNIEINDPNAWLLNNHWGLPIAHRVVGSSYSTAKDSSAKYKQYWYHRYRLEGVVALQEYLESTMTKENFEKIRQPVLLLYYYKDEMHQDPVVKVESMLEMFEELGTDSSAKFKKAMPNTGDHVLGSSYKSKDAPGVEREITEFLHQKLKLPLAENFPNK